MSYIDRALLFSPLDYVAVTCLIAGWLWIGWRMVRPIESLRDQVVARAGGHASTSPVHLPRKDEHTALENALIM